MSAWERIILFLIKSLLQATFDALIVVGSIVDIAITEVNVSTGVPPCDAVPASRSPPSLSFASSPPPSSFPLHYSHLFV